MAFECLQSQFPAASDSKGAEQAWDWFSHR